MQAPASTITIAQLRLIVWALVAQAPVLGVALGVLASMGTLPLVPDAVPYLDLICGGVGAATGLTAFLVRGQLFARARTAGDPAGKLTGYAQAMFVFHALLEGGILLNFIVVAMLPQPWPNVAVAAVLWALQVLALPSAEHCAGVTA